MKHLRNVLLSGLFTGICGFAQVQTTVEPVGNEQPLAVYPWDSESAFQKVPKEFLETVDEATVIYDHPNTMRVVPNPTWLRLLGVEKFEDQINKAFLKAQQKYYDVQQMHLKRMLHVVHEKQTNFQEIYDLVPHNAPDAEDVRRSLEFSLKRSPLKESVTFLETPFQDEGVRIKQELNDRLFELIGTERTEYLWKNPWLFHQNFPMMEPKKEMPKHDPNAPGPRPYDPNAPRFLVFMLAYQDKGLEILLNRALAGSILGEPTIEFRDQFLPEAMKPIMAKWRRTKRVHNIQNGFTALRNFSNYRGFRDIQDPEFQTFVLPHKTTLVPDWDAKSEYFHLPKHSIPDLRIAALDSNGEVSETFKKFFGLTTRKELNRIRLIYNKFKTEFEDLESHHMKLTDPNTGEVPPN